MALSISSFPTSLSVVRSPRLPPYLLSPPAANPLVRALNSRPSFRRHSAVVSCSTTVVLERVEEKQLTKGDKVRVRVRLDLQVKFGEHVAIAGSSKGLGLWNAPVPMNWTDGGWVGELELQGGEDVEFKIVIQSKEKKRVIWEEGKNRVLAVPESGVYDLVCEWNKTGEAISLLAVAGERGEEGEAGAGGEVDGSEVEDGGVAEGDDASTLVEQGSEASTGAGDGLAVQPVEGSVEEAPEVLNISQEDKEASEVLNTSQEDKVIVN